MGDDGVGVKVVEELRKVKLPRSVDIFDGSTLSFQLINFFSDYSRIIIVDAVDFGKRPGRVFKLKIDDVLKKKDINVISSHDFDVFNLIKILKTVEYLPRITFIGVQVGNIDEGIKLSNEVASAIPKVVKKILKGITPLANRTERIRRRSYRRVKLPPTQP